MSKKTKNAKATQKSNKNNNNSMKYYLITRKGLEVCTLQKETGLCYVVTRMNGKTDYCYKTRFIVNATSAQKKQWGLKSK